jgi:hypothetical protein
MRSDRVTMSCCRPPAGRWVAALWVSAALSWTLVASCSESQPRTVLRQAPKDAGSGATDAARDALAGGGDSSRFENEDVAGMKDGAVIDGMIDSAADAAPPTDGPQAPDVADASVSVPDAGASVDTSPDRAPGADTAPDASADLAPDTLKSDSVADLSPDAKLAIEGVIGTYYKGLDFQKLNGRFIDPRIDYYGVALQALAVERAGIDPGFSVRWEGQFRAIRTTTYTFYARVTGGVRLWVNGVLLVDKWMSMQESQHAGSIELEAGGWYDLKMESFQDVTGGIIQLSFASLVEELAVVPSDRLRNFGLPAAP